LFGGAADSKVILVFLSLTPKDVDDRVEPNKVAKRSAEEPKPLINDDPVRNYIAHRSNLCWISLFIVKRSDFVCLNKADNTKANVVRAKNKVHFNYYPQFFLRLLYFIKV